MTAVFIQRTFDLVPALISEAGKRYGNRIAAWMVAKVENGDAHRLGAWERHASNMAYEIIERKRSERSDR